MGDKSQAELELESSMANWIQLQRHIEMIKYQFGGMVRLEHNLSYGNRAFIATLSIPNAGQPIIALFPNGTWKCI